MATRRKTTGNESSLSKRDDDAPLAPTEPTTWGGIARAWPKTTFCIVSNEFCERFSFYGMRTVLTFYLLNVLKFSNDQSTIFFNSFNVLCYSTPILGSIIADGYVGKFWTIFTVSILYAAGQVVLAIASTKDSSSSFHPWLDLIGLITIGFGTGGIKPCVNSFGADQFEKGQVRMLSLFFSMFYFSINAGSMISTFIAPIFRSMSCMGQDSCYPLAFGIPAVLMIVATCLFMAASFWYKKKPPSENVFGVIFGLIFGAIGNKFRASEKKSHWLDHYMTTHDCTRDKRCQEMKLEKGKDYCHKGQYVDDVKQLFRVLIMFLPVPIFWSLYDQQGSIWLIQGTQMDCRLWGNVLFMPDQVQVLNAVLILVFIPIFQIIIYPIAEKFVTLTYLRKMVCGGLLAAAAFGVAGLVQTEVNNSLPLLPKSGQAYVSFFNAIPNCTFDVSPSGKEDWRTLNFGESMPDLKKTKKQSAQESFHLSAGSNSFQLRNFVGDCIFTPNSLKMDQLTYTFKSKKVYHVTVTKNGALMGEIDTDKAEEGTGEFSAGIIYALDYKYGGDELDNLVFCRGDTKPTECNPRKPSDFYYWEQKYNKDDSDLDAYDFYDIGNEKKSDKKYVLYSFKPVKPGKWWIFLLHGRPRSAGSTTPKTVDVTDLDVSIELRRQGGVYLYALINDPTADNYTSGGAGLKVYKNQDGAPIHFQAVPDNSVNILWQVPQIVVITAGEILFSITGYEFAYSQCAPSMKAVVQAAWLFTTAIGDTIIVLITLWSPFDNMATMFFAYAGVMAVVIVLFAFMSHFYYDYKSYVASGDDSQNEALIDDEDDWGKMNAGYQADHGQPRKTSNLEEYLDEDDLKF
ncbi:unnamed protein product, partial [Mesorhabditis belari]|uniref:Oligopeptide transporter 1 n=1 Tax=Mesorhabditis belari TaxID=2138241 RepID=A0AAF3FL43_9BILA